MKQFWPLLIILLIALGLRVWQLSELPVILNRDEAAIAYNALLLGQAGQDEWQKSWPLTLESFGDYKLPGYSWALVPLFKLLGFSDWVVRLPSALAGVGCVVMAYVMARHLRWQKIYAEALALGIAILPVFIFYSRMAFEANVGLLLTLIIVDLVFFSQWQGMKRNLVLAAVTLLAIFTYNTPLLLLPFFMLGLPLLKGWRTPKKWLSTIIILGAIGLVGIMVLLPLTQQKSSITLFSDPSLYPVYLEYRQQFTGVTQRVLGNQYVFWAQLMLERVMASFSPEFLVIKGGSHPWHQVPGKAHLYWSVYILAWAGVVTAVVKVFYNWRRKRSISPEVIYLYLLGVALLPSIITVDAPHATRSLFFFFMMVVMAVYGLQKLTARIVKKWPALTPQKILLVIAAMVLIETAHYSYGYFSQYPGQQGALKPGFVMALDQLRTQATGPIVIKDLEGYHYILVAWYEQIPADVYYASSRRLPKDAIGFSYGAQVGDVYLVKTPEEALALGAQEWLIWDDSSLSWQISKLQ